MNATTATTKKYGIIAVDQRESECSHCGRVDLNKVAWVVELDVDGNAISEAVAMGTTCAANVVKFNKSKIEKLVKSFDAKVRAMRNAKAREYSLANGENELMAQMQGLLYADRIKHPAWAQLMALGDKAAAYADSFDYVVELGN